MASNKNIIDVTKTGPARYNQLQQEINSQFYTDDDRDFYSKLEQKYPQKSVYDIDEYSPEGFASSLAETSTPFGESRYDKPTITEEELNRLSDLRGENQPWYDKVMAGVGKAGILAGTTFVNGTAGLLEGLGEWAITGNFSSVWDNAITNTMKQLTDASEEWLPNYYTQDEIDNPLDHLFNANFWGDKLIKNMGFMIGAAYSGGIYSKGLGALLKLTKLSTKAASSVTNVVGGFISAVNEGSIEALNTSKDTINADDELTNTKFALEYQALKKEYDDKKPEFEYIETFSPEGNKRVAVNKTLEEFDLKVQDLERRRQAELAENRKKAAEIGNMDLLLNIPILWAGDIWMFGKIYSRGFNASKKAANIIKNGAKYEVDKNLAKQISKSFLKYGNEGLQEGLQSAAANTATNYYNSFYAAKNDPTGKTQAVDFLGAMGQGIIETFSEESTYEEMLIGFLSAMFGVPRIRGIKNKESKFQSPIVLEGGLIDDIGDYKEQIKKEKELADYMNKRVSDPKFKPYIEGIVRHFAQENKMKAALEENDIFEFKNAEFGQLVSDIIMFDSTGRLSDLKDIIDNSFNMSDEELQALVDITTSTETNENGETKTVGPWIDSSGNSILSSPNGKQKMIESLTKKKENLIKTIDNYVKIKDSLSLKFGDRLSNSQLAELTWLQSQLTNWKDRADELVGETIKPIIKEGLSFYKQMTKLSNDPEYYLETISNLESLLALEDEELSYRLGHIKEEEIKKLEDILTTLNEVSYNSVENDKVVKDFKDINKLWGAIDSYKTKLNEFLSNPEKVVEENKKVDEEQARQETAKQNFNLKQILESSTTFTDFKNNVEKNNTEENREALQSVLKELADSGNKFAKDYQETTTYNKAVFSEISKFPNVSDNVINAAKKLFIAHSSNSGTLKDISNTQSIIINDENTIWDDNLTAEKNQKLFEEARYLVTQAMEKVNSSNKFKNSIAENYVKNQNQEEEKGTKKEQSTEQQPQNQQPIKQQSPTPNIDEKTEIKQNTEEFKSINDDRIEESDSKEKREGVQPIIPELHIEAAKEGQFVPFNEEVKKRESGVNFDILYNFLKDSGAFDYINTGNLKPGDTIRFMIDPNFSGNPDGSTIIFLVATRKDGTEQIVGNIPTGKRVASRYAGLTELINNIYTEYNQVKDSVKAKGEKWYSSYTTKVKQIKNGVITYSNEYQDLNILATNSSIPVLFGIMQNAQIVAPNVKGSVLQLKDIDKKEGRVYVLIKGADGSYVPAYVKVKHYNRTEFNINDASIRNTKIYENIEAAIELIAKSRNSSELEGAIKLLGDYLYVGDLNYTYDAEKKLIILSKYLKGEDGRYLYNEDGTNKEEKKFISIKEDQELLFTLGDNGEVIQPKEQSIEGIANQIREALLDFNLGFQVDLDKINKENYNESLISNGILSTRATSLVLKNSYFITEPLSENGTPTATNTPINDKVQESPGTNSNKTPVGGIETIIPGTPIDYQGITYYVDLENGNVYTEYGKKLTKISEQRSLILIEKLKQEYPEFREFLDTYNGKKDKVVSIEGTDYLYSTKFGLLDKFTYNQKEEQVGPITDIIKSKPLISSAQNTVNVEQALLDFDDIDEDEIEETKYRKTNSETKTFDKEKELKWLEKVLPQLSKEDRIKIIDDLIKVANNGGLAWGQFSDGVITLSNVAAEGTVYHEAFHVVFNMLLTDKERQGLIEEAKKLYGDKDSLSLEEDMAEDFRRYMTNRNSSNLLTKIKNFFKDLWNTVTNWNKIQPSLTALYRDINRGKFANANLNNNNVSRNRQEEYTQEMEDILSKAERDSEGNLLAPNGRKSNLTERQYAQVRTKAFKEWFGDWEKVNTFNIDAIDTSKVDIEEHDKPWKDDPTKSNKTLRIYIKGQHEKGYFELVKDHEFGIFSVHFKTGNADTGEIYGSTKEERSILYKQLLNAIPNGAQLSTWGELSEGGIKALNKLGKNLKKVGERQVKDRQGNSISIPIYQKGEEVSKVVDENGEPLDESVGEIITFNPNQIKSATDNIGTFSSENDDIRYRRLPSIKELRDKATNEYERLSVDLEETYREATEKVKALNRITYNTIAEARRAFNNSGIPKELFYRITNRNANNAEGYKIQILKREDFEIFKENIIKELMDEDDIRRSNEKRENQINLNFDSIDPEIQTELFNQGWTKEEFDSKSELEKEQAIKCSAI